MILGETRDAREYRHRKGLRRFAWFPRTLEDGRWVWLEPYLYVRVSNGNWVSGPVYRRRPYRPQ